MEFVRVMITPFGVSVLPDVKVKYTTDVGLDLLRR